MHKFNLLLCIFVFCSGLLAAQAKLAFDYQAKKLYEIYTVKNPNGSLESMNIDEDQITYFSSKFPQGVVLEILEGKQVHDLAEGSIWVRFPQGKQRYQLSSTGIIDGEIRCKNPDGNIQIFKLREDLAAWQGLFRCKNANGSIEYLYLDKDSRLRYRSNKQQTYTNLVLVEVRLGDMNHFEEAVVRFPNGKKAYKISMDFDVQQKRAYLTCLNPDGSLQRFDWLNKQP